MTTNTPPARLVLAAASLVLALALAPGAVAGKPGGTATDGGGSIALVVLHSTDGLPHFGQQVTFAVSTSATAYPWVTLDCYRSGALVYEASNGIFATSLNQMFTLGPTTSWSSGAADCTAFLQNWDSYAKHHRITTLTSTSFHVSP